MFLTKNLLIGLGSVGVIGASGYGIYSATRYGDESSKTIEDSDKDEEISVLPEGNEEQSSSLSQTDQTAEQQPNNKAADKKPASSKK